MNFGTRNCLKFAKALLNKSFNRGKWVADDTLWEQSKAEVSPFDPDNETEQDFYKRVTERYRTLGGKTLRETRLPNATKLKSALGKW